MLRYRCVLIFIYLSVTVFLLLYIALWQRKMLFDDWLNVVHHAEIISLVT